MKAAILCVSCLIVLCCVDRTEASVGEIFENIGHAFSVAWNSIIDLIKHPVRVKRLGPGGKRKAALKENKANGTVLTSGNSTRQTLSNSTETIQTEKNTIKAESTIPLLPATGAIVRNSTFLIPTSTMKESITDVKTINSLSGSQRLTLPLITTPGFMNLANWRRLKAQQIIPMKVEMPEKTEDPEPPESMAPSSIASLSDEENLPTLGSLLFIKRRTP